MLPLNNSNRSRLYINKGNSPVNYELDDRIGLINRVGSAMKNHDHLTWAHSNNVANISFALARHLDLPIREMRQVLVAGLLHDIGKLKIPRGIIEKPGRLDLDEYEWVQKHVKYGYQMLKSLKLPKTVQEGVVYHHERYDGKGYFEGLKKNSIPLVARIVAIADCYDALTAWRPYRGPQEPEVALKIMARSEGQFDPDLLNLFTTIDIDVGIKEFNEKFSESLVIKQ